MTLLVSLGAFRVTQCDALWGGRQDFPGPRGFRVKREVASRKWLLGALERLLAGWGRSRQASKAEGWRGVTTWPPRVGPSRDRSPEASQTAG
jgi:hypothetical protein